MRQRAIRAGPLRGQNEELRVSKVSPLYSTKRTSMKGVATSLMGHFRTPASRQLYQRSEELTGERMMDEPPPRLNAD